MKRFIPTRYSKTSKNEVLECLKNIDLGLDGKEYTLTVRDLSFQTGSEMIIVLLNTIITMPGLPKQPNYESFE